jgi:hypothetical protein
VKTEPTPAAVPAQTVPSYEELVAELRSAHLVMEIITQYIYSDQPGMPALPPAWKQAVAIRSGLNMGERKARALLSRLAKS